jgi:hypothetical protein
MKNLSIPIKYKDEAIPLLEKLSYKEDTWWNEPRKNLQHTHILAREGMWGFYNHDGGESFTPITIEELRELVNQTRIEELRELAGEPTPDKLDILIEQMRELRAELREFMGFIGEETAKPAEVREWNVGDKVRITKKETHGFNIGDVVELIYYERVSPTKIWLAQSQLGQRWWIKESEAELITE